jgi:general secretion pathway protein L
VALTILFAETFDEEGCLSLRFEADASISAPLAHRSFVDIVTLQVGSRTMVVLSTLQCGLHEVELPWLSDAKARAAIPFALEEQLAQKISTLHFAFDKAHHRNNRYWVVVIDSAYFQGLVTRLTDHEIDFDEITLDWFALQADEMGVSPSAMLVNVERYKGALSFELARLFLNSSTDSKPLLTFTDTPAEWVSPMNTLVEESFYLWAAKRLQYASTINLCQVTFKRDQKGVMSRKWLSIALGMVGIWLLTILVMNVINLYRINHQLNQTNQEIAEIYRRFFPGAQRVISPKFRISQLLQSGQTSAGTTILWQLLSRLEQALRSDEIAIEQLDYKNNAILVTVRGQDFNVLESLGERLKQAHVHVSQTQATSHQRFVTAVMELRI